MATRQDSETVLRHMNAHVVLVGNERDAARRREIVQATYLPDVSLYAPTGLFQGYTKLEELFDGLVGSFSPGAEFEELGPVQTIGDLALQRWRLGKKGEKPLVTGSDVCIFGEDGRIARAYVLLDDTFKE